ncbi:MAG: ATP-binding protein [Actinomycetota bacterium]
MSPTPDEAISIRVPARAEALHVVRSVVGSVAARHDLTIDAIEDLRIAVDEACAQLIAARGTAVTVEIAPGAGGVETVCTTDAEVAVWPPEGIQHSLAAQVLRGLTDSVAWERTDAGPSVRVGKRSAGAAPA